LRSAAVNILDLAKRNVDAIRLKNLDPLDYRERERESPDGLPPDASIAIKVMRCSQEKSRTTTYQNYEVDSFLQTYLNLKKINA